MRCLTGRECAKDTAAARRGRRDASLPSSAMDTTIETHALTKRYGRTVAVDELSIAVRPGLVTGFVGPNGAGKTTTMHLLLGLATADSGITLIQGQPYATIRRPLTVVGSLLDARAFHPSRSARSHLRWLAQSNGIPRRRVDEVLRLVGLGKVARRRAGAFSLGMRQRLGIAGGAPRRSADPHSRRAYDRPRPGGNRLDARDAARARRRRAHGLRLQPPHERARGHSRPPDRHREGPPARRHLGRRPARRRDERAGRDQNR